MAVVEVWWSVQAEQMDALRVLTQNNVVVVWVDNYCRLRYNRSPSEPRDRTINGTAFAVLPLPMQLNDLDSWPSLLDIRDRIHPVVRELSVAVVSLSNAIRAVILDDLGFSDVPCECKCRAIGAVKE